MTAGSGAADQSGLAGCPCQLGYAYDVANRLKTQAETVYAFACAGAGDRLKQIVNVSNASTYTLDLNPLAGSGHGAGLTRR
ncbi:MAG: hypothetical protein HZB53_03100 [Chloroflexi bacterium]|nr:hypothetical protein [Chloroflexota bacterium]